MPASLACHARRASHREREPAGGGVRRSLRTAQRSGRRDPVAAGEIPRGHHPARFRGVLDRRDCRPVAVDPGSGEEPHLPRPADGAGIPERLMPHRSATTSDSALAALAGRGAQSSHGYAQPDQVAAVSGWPCRTCVVVIDPRVTASAESTKTQGDRWFMRRALTWFVYTRRSTARENQLRAVRAGWPTNPDCPVISTP